MPFRKKSTKMKSRASKRMVVRKKAPKPYLKNMVNLGLGFPKKLMVTMKYSESFSFTSTLGVKTFWNYYCNNLNDVNQTGGGHQPFQYSKFLSLYDHWCVVGSKITCSIIPTGTVVPSAVGCFVNDDTTVTPSTLDDCIEQSKSTYKVLNNQSVAVPFTLKWSAKKAFGKDVLANNLLQGSSGTNPIETQVFTLFAGALDGTSTQTFVAKVNLEFIVVWLELKDTVGS